MTTHAGYLGGLEATLKSGTKAPYYCTSTTEVIYHVATWMPTDAQDPQQVKKVRLWAGGGLERQRRLCMSSALTRSPSHPRACGVPHG